MYPQLIPGLPLQTFGACIAVGILLAWKLVERLWKGPDLNTLVFLLVTAGIAGARIAHVVEYWHADGFDQHFLRVFAVWSGGLVFYGGLLAAFVVLAVWCFVKRPDVLGLADVLAVGVPLGHAFGRIGCFCYGCCWGKVSDSAIAVAFPAHSPVWYSQVASGLIAKSAPHTLPVLPTQLVEASALLVLFAVLFLLYRRFRAYTAATYCIGYGVLRFFVEFLRDDERPVWGSLSSAQNFSILLVAVGVALLVWSLKRNGEHTSDNR